MYAVGVMGSRGSPAVGVMGSRGSPAVGVMGSRGSSAVGVMGSRGSPAVGVMGSRGSPAVHVIGSRDSPAVGVMGSGDSSASESRRTRLAGGEENSWESGSAEGPGVDGVVTISEPDSLETLILVAVHRAEKLKKCGHNVA